MQQATFADKARYAFDNLMARGTIALVGLLAALSLVIIFVFTTFVWLTGVAPAGEGGAPSFMRIAWMSMMRTLDAGTMGGDSGSWWFLLAMFGVTLGGVFVISAFIGVLTSGVESRFEQLRKGRSRVIESGHTVILGWSPQVFTILTELVEANANKRSACVVVLGDHDKVEMEEAIRDRVSALRTTRVVCRSGSPVDMGDLAIASVQTSRAIIVLSSEGDDPDAEVIKTILAITNDPRRREEPYHIVAEIHDPKNMDAARLVGKDEVELVLIGDLISRITVQTCRQSGLSVVYTELLDFGGDEIYFKAEPKLEGKTYGEALFAFEDSAIMGLRTADGRILINPPMDTRVGEGDKVIAISEDDDTVVMSGKSSFAVDEKAIRVVEPAPLKPERTLLLGWNWRAPAIVNELDAYVGPGSEVHIVSDRADGSEELKRLCTHVKRQKVFFKTADTTDRRVLEALELTRFDHVILLCDDQLPVQRADARTLVSLLHVRDIGDKLGKDLSVVSEMLDIRNRELAEVARADDFIVSDKLVSLMLSQISENKDLNAVFEDLFRPEGSEIYLKPADRYIEPGSTVDFYTVLESARRRGQTAIGYRIAADQHDASKSYGVVTNPTKSETFTLGAADKVIVLAED